VTLENRAVGTYLGLAVGDALGATVEFMLPREIRSLYGVHDRIRGGGWLRLPAGQVTDDTAMNLALGRAILESRSIEARSIARAFDRWMQSKPVDISNTVRRGILHYRSTGELRVPESCYDAGNGACMRVLPVALATLGKTVEEIRAACQTQAWLTILFPMQPASVWCTSCRKRSRAPRSWISSMVRSGCCWPPILDSGFAGNGEKIQALILWKLCRRCFRPCLIAVPSRNAWSMS
jgi:ADP-ribosyl-[dinitrogen reductase] hydrolase